MPPDNDSSVSFREMVAFYTSQSERDSTVRAESLLQINNAIEKMESRFDTAVDKIEERFDRHEEWHREVLEKIIDQTRSVISSSKQNRIAVWAVVVAVASVLATLIASFHH